MLTQTNSPSWAALHFWLALHAWAVQATMLPLGQALVPTRKSSRPTVAQMELMPVEVWLQQWQHGVPPWSKINKSNEFYRMIDYKWILALNANCFIFYHQ